ncbi:MAG: outer membrane lipoprotein carrier protein LolA [Calditerrivibrio sp.]|nr:outer membrane lipoprotein carrier protein LolA [Calditerrivibrio sp.]
MKKILLITVLTFFLISPTYATKKNNKKPVQPSVVDRLKNIETISADFVQVTTIKNFSKETYKGKFYLIANQKALWDYTEPYKQYYFFDSRGMEYYDGSTNQVIRQTKNSSREAGLVLSVLFNFREIEKNFVVVVNGKSQIQLKPKVDIGLKYVMLLVNAHNDITGIHSEDINGNVTEITFSNLEINKKIDKSVFNVKYPESAQVFEY